MAIKVPKGLNHILNDVTFIRFTVSVIVNACSCKLPLIYTSVKNKHMKYIRSWLFYNRIENFQNQPHGNDIKQAGIFFAGKLEGIAV